MIGTYNRLNVHCSATTLEVCRAARRKIARKHRNGGPEEIRKARKVFYREMLQYHRSWQNTVRQIR